MRNNHLYYVFVFIKQREERKKVLLKYVFCYHQRRSRSYTCWSKEGVRVRIRMIDWCNESNQYTFDVWCVIFKIISAWTIERGANFCFKHAYYLHIISVISQQKNLGARSRFQHNAIALLKSKSNTRSSILQLRKSLWKFFTFSTISCWENENAMI